ncbi:MAG: molybdopterin-dependent oxidoreductase [Pseudomonadota bacterium]
MKFTSSHWGTYEVEGPGQIAPIEDDPLPSRIGRGWVSAAQDTKSRILAPAVRKGWLEGDGGAARGHDSFVAMPWDEINSHTARELQRVKDTYGNGAIFGGSYGWASAGRFHHAQSHLRRFLNLFGGYVASSETYSHAGAEVLFPHVLGMSNRAFQDEVTSLRLLASECEVLLALGGISERTAQISSAGVTRHDIGTALDKLRERGARIVNVSPRGSDLPGAEWLSLRPGTDTAFLLALAHHLLVTDQVDLAFLARCTSGWPRWRAYLEGAKDSQPKSPEWAAEICGISPETIRGLGDALVRLKSMIAVNWGVQRSEFGEQPLWAALGLAAMIGQIGQPGTGFSFGYGSTTHVGRASRLVSWPSVPQGRNPVDDFIPVARTADMLLNPGQTYRYNGQSRRYPDIRLIYWCGGNPFHHHQDLHKLDRAWKRPETVIVQDHSWTATARWADIVLPATSPLEREDIMMNRRDPTLIYMSPVMERLGEARDDFDIFCGLARALGFEAQMSEGRDAGAWLRALWAQAQGVAQQSGFALPTFEAFKETGRFDVPEADEDRIALKEFVADPEAAPLKTETGKITLFNKTIAGFDARGCPGHPTWLQPSETLCSAAPDELHLISGQPDTRLHSQNDRGDEALRDKINGREPAYLHPDAATARHLQEHDVIRIWSARGACLAGVRLDPLLRPDCIALATGAWFDPQHIAGEVLEVHGNPNVLTVDRGCSELSQGNMAHTTLVRIEKWTAPLPALSIDAPPEIVQGGGDGLS